MTKKNSTKRALLMSVMSLFLCFSMLIGTTFAWFTDSVSSKNNIIKSGNLDVELEYAKVVDGKLTAWDTVAGKSDVFDPNALWEPGRVEVVYLKVSNLGSLALKYQLGVNVYIDKAGTNVNNVEFKLSEHLVFTTVLLEDAPATPYTREEAIAKAGTDKGLKDYNGKTTTLEVGGEDYVALIVYMPETVGNEANYKKSDDATDPRKFAPQIELGINVFATQVDVEAEKDSFGDDYDEDAWGEGFKVYDADDLQDALNNGETNIVLMDDIVADESIVVPAPAVAKLSTKSSPSTVVINLNGKTISGTAKNLIYNMGNLVIEGDGKLISTKQSYAYAICCQSGSLVINGNISVTSEFGCVEIYNGSNVTINNGNYYAKGVNGNTSHTIYVGGYGTLNINGGTFDSGYSSGGIDTICGYGWKNDANEKAVINLNGGTFYPSELNGSYYFISNFAGSWTEININGGTFTKYNPAKIGGTKLGEGYKSVDNGDGTYTVLFPQESFENLIKNPDADGNVNIPAGTYNFPASELKEGMTLNCAPGTVFEGTSSLNVNGATIIGATFDAGNNDTSVSGTINGTFKDCTFTGGSEGLRWCYTTAGETVVFENCVFETDFRGIHFDEMNGDVHFINCEINGFNAYGGTGTATFEGCTFGYDASRYNGLNIYSNTVLEDCTFNFVSGKTNFIDFEAAGKTLTITNCTATLDGEAADVLSFVGGTYKDQTTITVDGNPVVATSEQLNAAIKAGAKNIYLLEGRYIMTNTAIGVTLKGIDKEKVVLNNNTDFAGNSSMKGAISNRMNFENLTFENTIFTMSGTGTVESGGGRATFTNVYFAAGVRRAYGTGVVFNNCTFGYNSEGYALHFESDGSSTNAIQLNDCVFEEGKIHLGRGRNYAFTGCDFAAGTDFQVWSSATIEGCTVDGVAITADNIATFFPQLIVSNVTIK